jgi:ABC-type phosphate/phosphonate transport system substrate-binding protein
MSVIKRRLFLKAAAALVVGSVAVAAEPSEKKDAPFTVVVMDPLAAPLSCPCVKGYAQRDYEKLAKHLEAKLGRPVKVFFGESLENTLAKKSDGKADLIVGKESVVRHEAKANKLGVRPVAALSGKDGKTTQTGLVVVAAKDPALTAADLTGYKVIFGEVSADEKHAAALALFKDLGVKLPEKPDTCLACTEGATTVVDAGKAGQKVATVISSYAQPLLEGCGTIQKGDLRVVGETEPVPFIVAFVNDTLPETTQKAVEQALLGISAEKALLTALETKDGFVALPAKKK